MINHNEKEEIRCIKCAKLLAKAAGSGFIEIKCPRCKEFNLFHITEEIKQAQLAFAFDYERNQGSSQKIIS